VSKLLKPLYFCLSKL